MTRWIERSGPTKSAASRALQDEIRARTRSVVSAPLRPESRFEQAAELWLVKLDAQVADGARAVTTADLYRQRLRSIILPAVGQWRLYECTISRLDGFFASLSPRHGAESRKTVRTIVSLILRVAAQHEAIPDNPIRHLDPIEKGSRKPRALTPVERKQFIDWLNGRSDDPNEAREQEKARRRDLPDIVTFMLGTGVRMGKRSACGGATSIWKGCHDTGCVPVLDSVLALLRGPVLRGGPDRGELAAGHPQVVRRDPRYLLGSRRHTPRMTASTDNTTAKAALLDWSMGPR
nr:hypothetical protein [Pseudonocardia sp. AL041005-10]